MAGSGTDPGADRRWVLEPAVFPVPVIACLPHGGRDYPDELAAELAIDVGRLRSDWLTRELYAFLPDLGITAVTTSLSRFVADVNRDPAGEQHGGFWTSVVAAQTASGRPVYRRPLSSTEIAHRIAIAHEPFHRALDLTVEQLTAQFGRVLLLDLHSFGTPAIDADVVLGDRNGATASPAAATRVAGGFAGHGFGVRQNLRFAGGWTVRRFIGDDRVDAIQVELNQRCYLDQAVGQYPPRPGQSFDLAGQRLHAVLAGLVSAA
jgi:N-formylglutamate deformylase